mmetsp:Transcript_563/g.1506  ORF Transcript_563/g.1506 Transcript_563/m.1506 type:complete len:245 (-) Transcript_563:16-750(-)
MAWARPDAVRLLVALVWALPARAARRGAPGRYMPPANDENTRRMQVEGNFVKLANGTLVTPFDGLTPESELAETDFVCHEGKLFGISIPSAKPPHGKVFSYLIAAPGEHWPLQVYIDSFDARKSFVLYPPVPRLTTFWQVLYRRADTISGEATVVERRMFGAGERHPCGPEGDAELREAMEREGMVGAPSGTLRKPPVVLAVEVVWAIVTTAARNMGAGAYHLFMVVVGWILGAGAGETESGPF